MRTLWLVTVFCGLFLTGCCGNEDPVEYPSPGGKWKYVTFERNCGATIESNFQVSVLPASAALPNEAGNVFIGDDHHGAASYVAELEWIDSNTLQIRYSSKARIFRQESRIGPIEIKYVGMP
jgi:hypothetical protein